MKYATRGQRLINFIVDHTIILILWVAIIEIYNGLYFKIKPSPELIDYKFHYMFGGSLALTYFLYFFLFELFLSRTIGKYITSTKVTDLRGEKANIQSIIKRTLTRYFAFECFTYLKKEPIGLHDLFSDTLVLKK